MEDVKHFPERPLIWKNQERSVNFNQHEIEILVSLAASKSRIIDSKQNDSNMWQEKERAWKSIEVSFNAFGGPVYRNSKNLKLKYETMKRETRKKLFTAEGTLNDMTSVVLSPVEQKIKEIILQDSLYDSDIQLNTSSSEHGDSLLVKDDLESDLQSREKSNVPESDIVVECNAKENDVDEPSRKKMCLAPVEEPIQLSESDSSDSDSSVDDSPPAKEWNDYTSSDLRVKQNPSKPKDKSPFEKLTEEKIEAAQLQKQLLKAELEQKGIQKKILQEELEHKRSIHDLEMRQHLLKIKLLKHEIRKNKKL